MAAVRRVTPLVVAFWLLIAASSMPGTVAAAPDGPTMNVTVGLGGWARRGGWLPVNVELANEGPDVTGQIVVDAGAGEGVNGVGPYRTDYVAEAILPRHSHKLIHVAVPFDGVERDLVVRLQVGNDTVIQQKVTPSLLEANQLLVGVLTDQPPTAFRSLVTSSSETNRSIVPVWLSASAFPERPELLGSVEVIVLDDFPTASLSDAQKVALRNWVFQGGGLVVVGGGDWRRTLSPLPADLLPITVVGDRSINSSSATARFAGLKDAPASPIVLSQATVQNGNVLLADQETPLVITVSRGLGRVTYFAVDPAIEPLASWDGSSRLWHALVAEALPSSGSMIPLRGKPFIASQYSYSQMTGALSNFPSLAPPSLRAISLSLAGYVLLIGFASYFILGRLRRREFGWVTVPVTALAFTIGTYGVARFSRGADVVVNTVSIVHLDPRGPTVAVSALGAFSPGGSDYHLTLDTPSLPLHLPTGYGGVSQRSANGSDVSLGLRIQEAPRQQSIDLLAAEPWALRAVWLRHVVDSAGQIEAHLRPEGQHLRGTVTNRALFPLEDCVLLAGDSYIHLGSLPVGATTTVDLDLSTNRLTFNNGPGGLYQVYGSRPVGQNGTADSIRDAEHKQQVFTGWLQLPEEDGGRGMSPAYFVGWTDRQLVAMAQDGRPVAGSALDLVVQPLDVELTGGFEAGPDLIPGKIVGGSGAPPYVNGPSGGLRLDHDAVEFEFLTAPTANLHSLGFHVSSSNVVGGSSPYSAQVFNWSTGAWDTISASAIRPDLRATPQFVNPAAAVAPPRPVSSGTSSVAVVSAPVPFPSSGSTITVDDASIGSYVAPTGLIRLRLSANAAAALIGTVSLVARGNP